MEFAQQILYFKISVHAEPQNAFDLLTLLVHSATDVEGKTRSSCELSKGNGGDLKKHIPQEDEDHDNARYLFDALERTAARINSAEYNAILGELSLLSFDFIIQDLFSADFSSGKPYNIDPNMAKRPDDIAAALGVKPNGSGLAATIYSAQKAENNRRHPRFLLGSGIEKGDLDHIKILTQLVNDQIVDFSAIPDQLENTIRIYVHFSQEDGDLKLPLSAVSDGTAKWIALITALMQRRTMFLLEEPENFLHPSMQRDIVSILRDTVAAQGEGETGRLAVLSTHSETLINCLAPKEIIIIDYVSGQTRANRVQNAEKVSEEINRSGFGLGYYFVNGALEG